jgi:hypothetical protein
MTVAITSTQDLWRVCLKSKWARIEIPELEFEISADGKRHVDSIYNHIASAVYNLGNYVRACVARAGGGVHVHAGGGHGKGSSAHVPPATTPCRAHTPSINHAGPNAQLRPLSRSQGQDHGHRDRAQHPAGRAQALHLGGVREWRRCAVPSLCCAVLRCAV